MYHWQARVGDWGAWQQFQAEIVETTRNVLEACRAANVGRVLHVSSVAVYGHPRVPPEGLTEEHPLGQRLRLWDHYCRAKMQAEELSCGYGLDLRIVRPTWIFGPMRDRNSLPHDTERAAAGFPSSVLATTC